MSPIFTKCFVLITHNIWNKTFLSTISKQQLHKCRNRNLDNYDSKQDISTSVKSYCFTKQPFTYLKPWMINTELILSTMFIAKEPDIYNKMDLLRCQVYHTSNNEVSGPFWRFSFILVHYSCFCFLPPSFPSLWNHLWSFLSFDLAIWNYLRGSWKFELDQDQA